MRISTALLVQLVLAVAVCVSLAAPDGSVRVSPNASSSTAQPKAMSCGFAGIDLTPLKGRDINYQTSWSNYFLNVCGVVNYAGHGKCQNEKAMMCEAYREKPYDQYEYTMGVFDEVPGTSPTVWSTIPNGIQAIFENSPKDCFYPHVGQLRRTVTFQFLCGTTEAMRVEGDMNPCVSTVRLVTPYACNKTAV